MGAKLSSFGNALYDSKKRQFLGRDGAGWGKLGIFYFFFYLGLAGFFCAMLGVFMALSPRDHPRYYSESSRMRTRSNPLAPGLGFRPQPDVDKNIILVTKGDKAGEKNRYVKNLNQYLQAYYPQGNPGQRQNDDGSYRSPTGRRPVDTSKFTIRNAGECTKATNYGFQSGRPCVLVKMNKVVGFEPIPLSPEGGPGGDLQPCNNSRTIPVHCYGEYAADGDNLGHVKYYSENGLSSRCGSLSPSRFPYHGKKNRTDVYQAPYVWAQFTNATANVLINVICRIYGANIDFDRKTGRALTRFQLFVNATSQGGFSDRAEL